jgi:hypothetical protein
MTSLTNSASPVAQSPMSGAFSRLLYRQTVLGKYVADYYFDDASGTIFVNAPHWLDEAYGSAIAVTDTGILSRNGNNIRIVSRALADNPHVVNRGIDLGGGYGFFVRGMRDVGVPFYWSDKYAENLVARGFEAAPGSYEIACVFEVLEHLENPLAFLREQQAAFQFHTCFFSATCFEEGNIPDQDWAYWSFETGQHISFFSKRSLEWMARELSMQLYHIEHDVFCFSTVAWDHHTKPKTLSQKLGKKFKAFGRKKAPPRQSLMQSDNAQMVQRLRATQRV